MASHRSGGRYKGEGAPVTEGGDRWMPVGHEGPSAGSGLRGTRRLGFQEQVVSGRFDVCFRQRDTKPTAEGLIPFPSGVQGSCPRGAERREPAPPSVPIGSLSSVDAADTFLGASQSPGHPGKHVTRVSAASAPRSRVLERHAPSLSVSSFSFWARRGPAVTAVPRQCLPKA